MITKIPLSKLVLETLEFENPRLDSGLDDESITLLAQEINHRGLLYPLLVWPYGSFYVVIGGQRRLKAVRYLVTTGDLSPDQEIAVSILTSKTIEEARETALADNIHREQLSGYEIARVLSSMEGTGEEIAAKVGLSYSHVSKLLATWRSSSDELKEEWRTGKLTNNEALRLSSLPPTTQVTALSGKEPILVVKDPPRRPDVVMPTGKKKTGPKGANKRPSVVALKRLLDAMPAPESHYYRGVKDALHYASTGEIPDEMTALVDVTTEPT